MKVFNGKEAAEQYMSSHTLTFSTPDLTLKRFSFWLGDIVPDPNNKEETMPRLMNYIEEKDFAPAQVIDDEKYEPSGALFKTGLYGSANTILMLTLNFVQNVARKFLLLLDFVLNVVLINNNRTLTARIMFCFHN